MIGAANWQAFRRYATREALIVTLLIGLAIVLFLVVGSLSRVFHAQQSALGERWSTRGVADLESKRFESAVIDFRTALHYSRDDYSYQLNLAQALIGVGRIGEAHAYLINLWDRQPENGFVNLELARVGVQQGETEQALRYYHNAIYATWPENEEAARHNVRLELIEYLLHTNARTQAQSELIALAANTGDDPSQQQRLGDLFLRAQDYEHALAAYRESLKMDRHNAAALAGAGRAALQLGQYADARDYLRAAVTQDPKDSDSAERLKITELVLQLDPFRPQLSVAERNRSVLAAFKAAGERLDSCSAAEKNAGGSVSISDLSQEWEKRQSGMTENNLRRNPDLVNQAMELVFDIERKTNGACGSLNEADDALLMIAKSHEGS
jgi:tetratricopeptide (TPR) repeat protein